jgi:hypothetical protein
MLRIAVLCSPECRSLPSGSPAAHHASMSSLSALIPNGRTGRLKFCRTSRTTRRRADILPARCPTPAGIYKALLCRSSSPSACRSTVYIHILLSIRTIHTRINKLGHTYFTPGYVYPFSFLKDHCILNYEGVSSNPSRLCV